MVNYNNMKIFTHVKSTTNVKITKTHIAICTKLTFAIRRADVKQFN